jgi:hypothetical protein
MKLATRKLSNDSLYLMEVQVRWDKGFTNTAAFVYTVTNV